MVRKSNNKKQSNREGKIMTLNEIIKIQSIIDNRKIAVDTYKTLNTNYYFSKSKKEKITLGDMHIDHFLRAIKVSKLKKIKGY